MLRAALFAVVGVALAAGLFLMFRPATEIAAPAPAEIAPATTSVAVPQVPVEFELVVKGGKLVSGPHVLNVMQNQNVMVHVTSDREEELHLHGYDLKVELHPGQRASLVFTATQSGRFEYELEKSGVELGAMEVLPR
jgi:uncharacterized cupredoxin-like copper-binding protein